MRHRSSVEPREILNEDGRARGRETARLARRISNIDWFRRQLFPRDPAERIAAAVRDHAALLPLEAGPAKIMILPAAGGRSAVREERFAAGSSSWHLALHARCEAARGVIIASSNFDGHPLLVRSGDAILMRPDGLPLAHEEVWDRLAGSDDDRLPDTVVEPLYERQLWQLAAMLAWDTAGDQLGANPFLPVLTLYEEGLYPLAFTSEAAVLWAP